MDTEHGSQKRSISKQDIPQLKAQMADENRFEWHFKGTDPEWTKRMTELINSFKPSPDGNWAMAMAKMKGGKEMDELDMKWEELARHRSQIRNVLQNIDKMRPYQANDSALSVIKESLAYRDRTLNLEMQYLEKIMDFNDQYN